MNTKKTLIALIAFSTFSFADVICKLDNNVITVQHSFLKSSIDPSEIPGGSTFNFKHNGNMYNLPLFYNNNTQSNICYIVM